MWTLTLNYKEFLTFFLCVKIEITINQRQEKHNSTAG